MPLRGIASTGTAHQADSIDKVCQDAQKQWFWCFHESSVITAGNYHPRPVSRSKAGEQVDLGVPLDHRIVLAVQQQQGRGDFGGIKPIPLYQPSSVYADRIRC